MQGSAPPPKPTDAEIATCVGFASYAAYEPDASRTFWGGYTPAPGVCYSCDHDD